MSLPTWIQTAHGRVFDLAQPRPEDIHVDDIAHHLAAINRYTGAARRPYNVAQHSCLVSQLLPPRLRLAGLLHDAAEAYTGDWSSPMKVLIRAEAPGLLEKVHGRIEQCVRERFGLVLTEEDHDLIKWADLTMLATEKRDLMPRDTRPDWAASTGSLELPPPLEREIKWPWSFDDSKFNFESHFNLYTTRR